MLSNCPMNLIPVIYETPTFFLVPNASSHPRKSSWFLGVRFFYGKGMKFSYKWVMGTLRKIMATENPSYR